MSLKLLGKDLTGVVVIEDSFYIPNFLSLIGYDHDILLKEIYDNIKFIPRESKEMLYRGNQLSREKFFLIKNTEKEVKSSFISTLYKYTYPGFQYASMQHYRYFETLPLMAQIILFLENNILYNDNKINITQGIGTKYELPSDNIGYHNDKLTDIKENSPILTISLGDVRELHLALNDNITKPSHILVMEPGSLFILGPRTNTIMKHCIVPINKEQLIKRDKPFGIRISMVFRDIKTIINQSEVQKKVAKSKKKLAPTVFQKIKIGLKSIVYSTPKIQIKIKDTKII